MKNSIIGKIVINVIVAIVAFVWLVIGSMYYGIDGLLIGLCGTIVGILGIVGNAALLSEFKRDRAAEKKAAAAPYGAPAQGQMPPRPMPPYGAPMQGQAPARPAAPYGAPVQAPARPAQPYAAPVMTESAETPAPFEERE